MHFGLGAVAKVGAFGGKADINRMRSDVRFWHKADISRLSSNVRFRGESGHDADVLQCLLLTQSGHRSSAKAKFRFDLDQIQSSCAQTIVNGPRGLSLSDPTRESRCPFFLDDHLIRGAMVFTFFAFSIQNTELSEKEVGP